MKDVSRSFRYPVSPLEAVVLVYNVLSCPDAANDADRTVEELVSEIDTFDGYLSKGVLEAALYCCNLNDEYERKIHVTEDGTEVKFWHPFKVNIERFLTDLLPPGQKFDRYYNILYEEKENGFNAKTGR